MDGNCGVGAAKLPTEGLGDATEGALIDTSGLAADDETSKGDGIEGATRAGVESTALGRESGCPGSELTDGS